MIESMEDIIKDYIQNKPVNEVLELIIKVNDHACAQAYSDGHEVGYHKGYVKGYLTGYDDK